MSNLTKIVFLMVATIIGAGFSSGKEIMIFFNETGNLGWMNIILAGIIFICIIALTMILSKKNNIYSYEEFLVFLSNRKVGKLLYNIIIFFLLLMYYVMVSAFGAYISQVFGISKIWGIVAFSIMCYITFKFDIEGLINISKYLVPFIILGITLIYIFATNNVKFTSQIFLEKIVATPKGLSGILYASYNLVIAIPVLISVTSMIRNRKSIYTVTILTVVILLALIIMIYMINNLYFYELASIDMPLLYVARIQGIWVYFYYILVVSMAIYTTAISSGYCVLQKFSNKFKVVNILMCFGGILVSPIDFSVFMKYTFNLIGIFGIVQLVLMIIKCNRKMQIEREKKCKIK